jgi:hypothetical protein
MSTTVPMGDESAMNLEDVGVLLSIFLLFSETFLRIGSELRSERGFLVSGDLVSSIGVILWAWPTTGQL